MNDATVVRTRSVLTLDQERAGNPPGGLFFKGEDDVRPVVQLDPEQWRDLGNPEQITIAIFPGDRQDLFGDDFPL